MNTPVSKKQFEQYESLRRSGAINMWDWKSASEILGWDYGKDKDTYLSIIKNYSELREKYGAK